MTEKEKYDKMHLIPGYSPGPGVAHVQDALKWIKGDSVIDFGCGTGDAAKAFMDSGNEVYCVDISRNGLKHDFGKRFFQSALHDLPAKLPKAKWGFCCDTMEHLPEEWVAGSLSAMSRKVDNCYFTISGVPDTWGARIGETLHLTVKPFVWWEKKLKEHWDRVTLISDDGSSYQVVTMGRKC